MGVLTFTKPGYVKKETETVNLKTKAIYDIDWASVHFVIDEKEYKVLQWQQAGDFIEIKLFRNIDETM